MTEAFRRGYVDQMQKLAGLGGEGFLAGSFLGRNAGEMARDYFHTGKYMRDLYNVGSAVSHSVMPITRLFKGIVDKGKNKLQEFEDETVE